MASGYWFSKNPDKAWAEKFFLTLVPYWFFYNMLMVQMGWLETGTFWNIMQNVLMWIPYMVILPWVLRRNSGIPWYESYWFKYNVYLFWFVFLATYFHTEYFFEVLGLRYRFEEVTLFFDSALLGPDEATALETFQKIPPSMYFNAIVFFAVYHTTAIIVMRRIRSMTDDWQSSGARFVAWCVIVALVAAFWGWGETYMYFVMISHGDDPSKMNVWYENLDNMLWVGSWFYALYFIVSFPNIFRLDEQPNGERWSIPRIFIESSFVCMIILLLVDFATWILKFEGIRIY